MLGGCTRDVAKRSTHLWSKIMTVTPGKQQLFIQRIILLHDIASKRGGRACVSRLSLAEWTAECDRSCFVGHMIEYMEEKMNDDGNRMFLDEVLATIGKRCIEGTLGLHYVMFSLEFLNDRFILSLVSV